MGFYCGGICGANNPNCDSSNPKCDCYEGYEPDEDEVIDEAYRMEFK
jgi:hypothetical protein